MNTETGQITNDPELIEAWRKAGVRVMELPTVNPYDELAAAEEYTTPPVIEKPQETPDKRLARALNNARLNQLCGKRG